MNPWEAHLKVAQKYLDKVATVHIFAYPHFVLECLLGVLLVMIYIYLDCEVRRIHAYTVKIRQRKVPRRRSVRESSRASIKTSITHVRHEYCEYVKSGHQENARLSKMSWVTGGLHDDIGEIYCGNFTPQTPKRHRPRGGHGFTDRLTALTPAQFVRLDKEEQRRSIQTVGCMQSLTTLFTNIMSQRYPESQMREQLDKAKEDCECSHVSDQVMKYLDSECVTESLIDVLNDIIDESTGDYQLPMNGDLTTLVYDIGNLARMNSSSLLDTRSSFSSSDAHGIPKTNPNESHSLMRKLR